MIDTFETLNLDPSLVSALKKENINAPTDVQGKVIPLVLQNKDLIVQSETGTGKTLAYLLPLYGKIHIENREMQAIILVPTHELAVQIQRQIERLSQNSELKVNSTTIIGNVNIDRQIEKLKEKPHIIVGTPGRILELIKKKKISAHTIKTIIIDEADRLMDINNQVNVKAVIKCTMRDRQLMMFSASISQETIAKAKEFMKEPEIIRAENTISVPPSIEHFYFLTEQRGKFDVLRKLLRMLNPSKAIVFMNNSVEIQNTLEKLKYHRFNVESIHGSNVKLNRKKAMDEFRAGKLEFLIASDVAARGLHIEGITHIFNMDLPEDPRDYLHRVGRTGRNGNKGIAVSIVTEREVPLIKAYEKTLKINIAAKDMYKGNLIDAKN